ncbi:MAG: beta-lactamase family protein [Sphingomonas bacterium]|nr:beta-lactamase family protein [Sphingomonas bacterium]
MIRHFLLAIAAFALGGQSVPSPRASLQAVSPARVTQVLDASGLAGTILIGQGDRIVYERAFGPVAPAGAPRHRLGQVWRYASVTKQWTATIAMQEVAAGRLDLDMPIKTYLPASKARFADRITSRMLMQHVSGLPRTEESPVGADEWPTFYLVPPGDPRTGVAYCEGSTDRAPPAEFRYGDCDFIMLGAVLERISGKSFAALVRERITRPLRLDSVGLFPRTASSVVGYEANKRESRLFRLENFGAAGALYGTTHDLFRFDRALMTGKLVPDAQRAIMWTGDPKFGYAALGQWAFSAPLKGCGATPVRFVERRGAIGGMVLRNIILPELDMVVIMTANRAEADAAFGEIWQQRGISHDVLAAAICPKVAS